MKIKEVKGDIITLLKEKKIDVLIHGCNCMGIMGKGLAKQIKESFNMWDIVATLGVVALCAAFYIYFW